MGARQWAYPKLYSFPTTWLAYVIDKYLANKHVALPQAFSSGFKKLCQQEEYLSSDNTTSPKIGVGTATTPLSLKLNAFKGGGAPCNGHTY